MKVILHIGLPKTGSTSIQEALTKSRSQLKKHGILYPRIHLHNNHNLLSLPFRKSLPRTLGKLSKQEKAEERARAKLQWSRLGWQVEREKPRVLILSSEYFAFLSRPRRLISTVSETIRDVADIEVIAYLRRPSQHYVSLAQQKLKASAALPPPQRIQYAEVLAPFREVCNIKLREMHPQKLVRGEVVADFSAAIFPDGELMLSLDKRKNESVSAEAMVLIQEFRRNAFNGQDHILNVQTTRLIQAIRAVEAKHGGAVCFTRPRLRPNLERHLDYDTADNRKLKKQYGFTFYDLKDQSPEGDEFVEHEYRNVDEVLTVDAKKLEVLRALVIRELTSHRLDLTWISSKLSRWRRI